MGGLERETARRVQFLIRFARESRSASQADSSADHESAIVRLRQHNFNAHLCIAARCAAAQQAFIR